MPKLDDVLEALDEDDAKAIRDALAEKDELLKAKSRTERDLRLATDSELRKTYPRAFRAYELKELDFGESTTEADVLAILKTNEEKLAKLGVPISTEAAEPQAPTTAATPEPTPDPAAAFGTPVAGGPPSGSRNLPQEFLETMTADSTTDRARMAEILGEMQGHKDQIEDLVDRLNARPIMTRDVAW